MPDQTSKYDFSSPFMACEIVNPVSGDKYPLWTNLNAQNQPNLAAQQISQQAVNVTSLPFVTNISIENQMADIPTISLTFQPPFREGVALLDSPVIEWGISELHVRLGYTGGTMGRPLLVGDFVGLLLTPQISLAQNMSITFKAHGLGGFSATRQESPSTFDGKTPMQMITAIAQGPSANSSGPVARAFKIEYQVQGLAKDGSQNGSPGPAATFLTMPQDHVSLGGDTDYMALQKFLFDANCFTYFRGDTMIISERTLSFAQDPKYSLSFFNFPNGTLSTTDQFGVLPILSAESPQMALYMSGATKSVAFSGIDSGTRSATTIVLDSTNNTTTSLGQKSGQATAGNNPQTPDSNSTTGQGGQLLPLDPSDPNALARATAQQAANAQLMGVPLVVTTLGVPDLFPGDVVRVQSLGKRIDTNYAVMKVNHTFGPEGFTTELEMNNSLVPNTTGKGVAPGGTVNTQKPDPNQQNISVSATQNGTITSGGAFA